MQDIVATYIYKTKNYDKFTVDPQYNRDVNMKHVDKIVKSYKEFGDYGQDFPIVVDESFRIIDGQHRFNARKKLGLTIFYIQSLDLDSIKLGGINDAIAKWKTIDFQKASQNGEIVKLIESFKKDLWDFELHSYIRGLSINRKNLITPSVDYVNKQKDRYTLIKPCCLWIKNNIDCNVDISNAASSQAVKLNSVSLNVIFSLATKLAKYKVKLDDLPINMKYGEFMSYVYQNNLVK